MTCSPEYAAKYATKYADLSSLDFYEDPFGITFFQRRASRHSNLKNALRSLYVCRLLGHSGIPSSRVRRLLWHFRCSYFKGHVTI